MIKFLTKDFDEEIREGRILVDFYADRCGPCRMMGEIIESIDSIDILKVNVDKYPLIAQRYGIMSIPTLMLFEDGNIIKTNVGMMNEDMLKDFIK